MKTEPAEALFDFHPLANLFPLMDDEELSVLAFAIQENGQREPIILYEGKILDGRNRFRALKALNLPINTLNFDGNDPVGYVADHNLHRRHLKASQRAAVAALLSEFPRGRRRVTRDNNLDEGAESEADGDDISSLTQDEAANKFGISKRLVAAGTKVKKQGHPDLINLVKDGRMSIESAILVADLPMDSQEQVLNSSAEDFKKAIKDVRNKSKLGKSTGKGKVANQAASNSSVATGALLIPLDGEASSLPSPVAEHLAEPLSVFYDSLMHVGELVLTSGFDAEEWFVRHGQHLPETFSAKHMRAVMSALGVVEQLIDLIQERETD